MNRVSHEGRNVRIPRGIPALRFARPLLTFAVLATGSIGCGIHPPSFPASALVGSAGGPYMALAGMAVSFDGSKSTAPAGQTLSYAWNFGDGSSGTGVDPAHSYATAGSYTVILTVTASGGGTASSTAVVTITAAPPTISAFIPSSAPIGTNIKLTGTNLAPPSGTTPVVTLSQQGGATITAPVGTSTSTSLSFVIPPGATTGPILLTIGNQSVSSSNPLVVTTSSTFSVSTTPGTATLVQGQSVALAVTINSTNGFAGLATLSVAGLPTGVTASFQPSAAGVGQSSVLTFSATQSQPIGTSTLTISASAMIDDQTVIQSSVASLNVTGLSTSFLGRTVVDDAQNTPIAGVTVKFTGKDDKGNTTGCAGQAVSDQGGNFLLTSLPTACIGPQLISYDGSTASSPAGKYAGVNLSYTLTSGEVTASPVLVHLPRIDNAETVQVQQKSSKDQIFHFSSMPGLTVTVYAGTTIALDDGSQPNPFPLVGIQIPIDRLPEAIPTSGMLMPFIVAFQPANAVSSQPVAVDFPNLLNSVPGSSATFSTLDPTHGYMVPYGTGTVSQDGTVFLADADPAHTGHRYGLVHFDWHGPTLPPPSSINPAPPPLIDPRLCVPCLVKDVIAGSPALIGKPVDLSSGLEVLTSTDISIDGGRGGIGVVRTYRNFSYNDGPFGLGTNINYGYQLDTSSITSGLNVIGLVAPDGGEYSLASQGNKTWTNSSVSFLTGAVMSNPSSGVYNLKWKDGTVWQFQSPASSPREAFLTSVTDPNGNAITIAVHQQIGSGGLLGTQITQVTDPVGRTLRLTYNGDNHITSISEPAGRSVHYSYNTLGQLETFTAVDGGVTTYRYNERRPGGSAQARTVTPKAAAGLAIQDLSSVTDARGNVIAQNTYDANHRVVSQVEANGGTYTFAYTLQNPNVSTSPVSQTTVTDPLNNVTVYRFNSDQTLASVQDAAGQTTTFSRDGGAGNSVSSITGLATCAVCGNPAQGDRTFTHDADGNVLSEIDALGSTTTYTYDPILNKVTSITDALGDVSKFKYDSKGNLTSQQDPDANTTTFAYNAYGQITQINNALSQVTILTYDDFGNLASITNPLKNTTTIEYDGLSHPIKTTDALQRASSSTYDTAGHVLTQTNAQGGVTKFTYDPNGNLTALTDANSHTTTFTYDPANRLLAKTDPLGNSDARVYDGDGNLVQFTDRRGQTSKFTYDAVSRLVSEAYADSSVSRIYDEAGRLSHVTDSAGGDSDFTYDVIGRLKSSVNQVGAVQYTYDKASRTASRQVVGQSVLNYAYDAAGNLMSATLPEASATFTYDALNRTSKINRGNGVSSQYSYDVAGNLLSIADSGGAGVANTHTYSYDAVGNRTVHSTNLAQPLITQAATSTYDNANRLISRADSTGSTTYTYDGNGNLTSETAPGGMTRYIWDSRNRLQSITAPAQTDSLIYDSGGNLISQSSSGSTNLTRTFVLDPLTNVGFIGQSTGDNLSVLEGQYLDQHLAAVHSSGQVEYRLTDALDSTGATVDQTGKQLASVLYEPFGQTTTTSRYAFEFTGRIQVNANTYYYRARFYNSKTGRFISEDRLLRDSNNYRYVLNSPNNYIDPSGLQATGSEFEIFISDATSVGYFQLQYPSVFDIWLQSYEEMSLCRYVPGQSHEGPADALREFRECVITNLFGCRLGHEEPHAPENKEPQIPLPAETFVP